MVGSGGNSLSAGEVHVIVQATWGSSLQYSDWKKHGLAVRIGPKWRQWNSCSFSFRSKIPKSWITSIKTPKLQISLVRFWFCTMLLPMHTQFHYSDKSVQGVNPVWDDVGEQQKGPSILLAMTVWNMQNASSKNFYIQHLHRISGQTGPLLNLQSSQEVCICFPLVKCINFME